MPSIDWQRWAARYARVAIGAAFLSAVAGRFELWSGVPSWSPFERFIRRTAELNPFVPEPMMPLVAWAATVLETTLGLALIAGVNVRWAAFGSAALLAWFAVAMASTAGVKSPLDYSVFSASAGAWLLALAESRRSGAPSPHDSQRDPEQAHGNRHTHVASATALVFTGVQYTVYMLGVH